MSNVASLVLIEFVTAVVLCVGVMIGWRAAKDQTPIVLPSLPSIRRGGGEKKPEPKEPRQQENP